MSDPVIRTEGLVKRYRSHLALGGLDLEVRQGEVFGFPGPNGAGKTTTIRLLLDVIRPTRGRVEVLGQEPRAGGAGLRRRLSYLPGELPLAGRETAGELLGFLGNLRGGAPSPDPRLGRAPVLRERRGARVEAGRSVGQGGHHDNVRSHDERGVSGAGSCC